MFAHNQSRVRRLGPGLALLLAAAFGAGAPILRAEAPEDVEARVKAAFLYNFVRFVQWPALALGDAQAPITIGVAGKDILGTILDETVQGKNVSGHPINIRRIASAEQAEHCAVLYITDKKQLKNLRPLLAGKPILTVGDFDGALREGTVIGFRLVDDSVRFEIDLDTAGHAGLNISSQLLKVAVATSGSTSGKIP